MSNAFSKLMLALVLLGFLTSTTMHMYGDMEQLKTENQNLSHELSQLGSDYQAIVKERDLARAGNANLQEQLNELQAAYETENQARLKAEADSETYKYLALNAANGVKTAISCTPAEPQAITSKPVRLLLSNIGSLGAGSFVVLVIAGLVGIMPKRVPRK